MRIPVALRWALHLAPSPDREAMLGDVAEEYAERRRADGDGPARRWAHRQALRSLLPALRLRVRSWRDRASGGWIRLGPAVRALRTRPLHAGLMVLTFALGVGLNTAILATASRLLLAPLPYDRGDRLVVPWPGRAISPGILAGIREASPNFDAVALTWDQTEMTYLDPSGTEVRAVGYTVAQISLNYLDLLGIRPLLGRTFREGDLATPGALPTKAILTFEAWRDLFDSDPDVVGQTTRSGDVETEIVGVMPPEATPMAKGLDGWTPVGSVDAMLSTDRRALYQAVARLAPSATLDQARAELEVRLARADTTGRGVELPQWTAPARFGPVGTPVEERTVSTLREYLGGNSRGGLVLLALAGVATLLVALVNASALALNRGLERHAELNVRRALGADSRDVLSLVLGEQVVLATAGGAAALLLAWAGADVLGWILPEEIPRALLRPSYMDTFFWTAIATAFCALASTAVAVLPHLRGFDLSLADTARTAERTGSTARRSLGLLLTGQVALITALMIGAGVLGRTLERLRAVDPGFDQEGLVVLFPQASTLPARSPETPAGEVLDSYFRQVEDALVGHPSVEAVGQGPAPFTTPLNALWEITEGTRVPEPGVQDLGAAWRIVGTGDYFRALGVDVVAGRTLEDTDVSGPRSFPDVAVVNESFAAELWPNEDAVGRTFFMGLGPGPRQRLRIVGVVEDFRFVSVESPPVPSYFTLVPWALARSPLIIRVTGDPEPLVPVLASRVRSVDPRVPLLRATTQRRITRESIRDREAALVLLAGLAGIGLVLGLLGIYGVTALQAARRTREIGIRRALGARRPGVVGLVMARGMAHVAAGVALGVLVAAWATPALASMLYRVRALDPVSFLAVPAVLLACAAVASALPALRAARSDPSRTLRES